jgi:hypothetical protein
MSELVERLLAHGSRTEWEAAAEIARLRERVAEMELLTETMVKAAHARAAMNEAIGWYGGIPVVSEWDY